MSKYIIPLIALTLAIGATAQDEGRRVSKIPVETSSFNAGKGTFMLDGVPFIVKAAELHYPRIPREYWDHRIKMCKALGMNTICLYTFWNAHEPEPGKFDFTGQNDLRQFVRLCQENDMKVILRPGPYVCAEWEMGGLPWWLLRYPDIRLRENDPRFIRHVDEFQKQIAAQVGDLTVDKGGPIIMVQVENEYGSYGTDPEYVATIRDMLRKNFGNKVTLFQCDWASNFENNGLNDLIWTMNFGTGADIDSQFSRLKELRPDSPLMCSEFWSGWFDKWGAAHETRPATEMIAGLSEMLDKGISFSLYMTHGGTNWGHWAGANSPGFSPDVTSYDYDAPINEQGAPTEKYHMLREMMTKHSDAPLPDVPPAIPVVEIPAFSLSEVAPLFDNLPESKIDSIVRPMEYYNQGFGSILYRTLLPDDFGKGTISVTDPHDYAQIFINGKYIGELDRRENQTLLPIPGVQKGDTLDILIEAMGRINFGRAIKDRKGITEKVTVIEDGSGKTEDLKNWSVFNLPDDSTYYSSMVFSSIDEKEARSLGRLPRGLYRGTFQVERIGDTFLDMGNFGKGLVYVNGHGLGRHWEIGPQQTLYLPGVWLHEGENEILIFDVIGPKALEVRGLQVPILDSLNTGERSVKAIGPESVSNLTPVLSQVLERTNGWKSIGCDGVKGEIIILSFPSTSDGVPVSISEIYLLDSDGNRLSREEWKISGISSELKEGNHTGEKLFDLQESTYWSSADTEAPSFIRIDLGKPEDIGGLELLPRMETGAPGAPDSVSLYVVKQK